MIGMLSTSGGALVPKHTLSNNGCRSGKLSIPYATHGEKLQRVDKCTCICTMNRTRMFWFFFSKVDVKSRVNCQFYERFSSEISVVDVMDLGLGRPCEERWPCHLLSSTGVLADNRALLAEGTTSTFPFFPGNF